MRGFLREPIRYLRPNPRGVGHEAERFHKNYCGHGGFVAAYRTSATAGPSATDRCVDGLSRERLGRASVLRRIPRGTSEARVGGGPQHPARHAVGDARRWGDETAVCERTCRATTRSHSFV